MDGMLDLFDTLRMYSLYLLAGAAALFVLLGLYRIATKGQRERAIKARHDAIRLQRSLETDADIVGRVATSTVRSMHDVDREYMAALANESLSDDFDQSNTKPGPRVGTGWQSAARYGSGRE